ncbi:hypothetical protein EUX98_g8459 [Antrodiella citrinella]|uniref:OPT family small oligopeptide transporter n=1 Tax=Antrodiella citrinella TaxID=2447956 RepID=A0A4V3XGE1_9APHY|nr:hypothetical protein EUX98_g8459 [Antrodiella citrinella]
MTRPSTSSRPVTASGRPTTARPDTSDAYFDDRAAQYTYSQDGDDVLYEEEEDESDAEGVFAFARPPTGTSANVHSLSSHATVPPPDPLLSPSVAYPPRTFDPVNEQTAQYPTAGPSTVHTRHAFQYPQSPVESPPSTTSQPDDDPYRLRRMPPQTSSRGSGTTGRRSGVSSAISSREVHVALPTTRETIDEELAAESKDGAHKMRPPSSSTSFPTLDSRDGSIKMEFDFDAIDEEDSPYAEVRAAVSNIDDPEMPCLTLRMWIIGLFLTLTTAAANVFFVFRQPAPSILPSMLLLIAHPIGKFLAFSLPITPYRTPAIRLPFTSRMLGPYQFSLNPGPWNIKEHALVYMMSNVATSYPYALFTVVVAEFNYGDKLGYGFAATLVLATQMTGFGLAGMSRKFLVWPASMLWPQNLVTCTILNTFHAEEDSDRGGLTRYRYFVYVGIAAFCFFFLPGYLFTALSIFNWVCWIAPNNTVINQIFGVYNGLGMSVLTFDWTEITWISNPLVTPWWAQMHTFFGFVCFYWILAPAMYYANVWHLAYFPMLTNSPYDRFGNPYDVSRVLRPDDTFDVDAFNAYSQLYLPTSYAITYLVAFALSSCIVVHTALYYGQAVWRVLRKGDVEKDDIHAKLMRAYPEVPNWWYAAVFVTFLGLSIVASEVWHTGLPVWAILLAILLVLLYVIPAGYIYALTNQTLTTNLMAQIVPGVLLPGKPIANMIFKSYVIQSLSECTSFVMDLKLGHYIKVPPRATFMVQITATALAGFVQVGVKQAMFDHIKGICTPDQKSDLTCPHNQVYYTASAVWGLIGPSRQFGSGSIYHPELYALIVGAFLPLPFWYYQRRWPNAWNKWISTPVILNSVQFIPPATGINYSSWFVTGFVFQYVIRKKNFAWWSKFNYVTAAALDSGTLVCLLFIFFVLQIPKGGLAVNWWGNSIWQNTDDFRQVSLLTVPSGGLPNTNLS